MIEVSLEVSSFTSGDDSVPDELEDITTTTKSTILFSNEKSQKINKANFLYDKNNESEGDSAEQSLSPRSVAEFDFSSAAFNINN